MPICVERQWALGGLDFRFPLGSVGFSSGWRRSTGFCLNRQPQFSARLATRLAPCGRSRFLALTDNGLKLTEDESGAPPFMVKQSPGTEGLDAVSSGGGSATFSWGGRALKMKRCGFAEDRFRNQPFYSPALSVRDGEIYESCNQSFGGLMELESALMEVMTCRSARELGLSRAYRPIGVIVLLELPDLPFPDRPFGAALFEIESDLRVDEVLCMALTPLIVDLIDSGRLSVNDFNEFHGADGFALGAMLETVDVVRRDIAAIGRASGGLYRMAHDHGLLRGIGSSWFGNEVIGCDGHLSLVDFDGGMMFRDNLDPRLADSLAAVEIESYCAESYTFLTDMKPVLFGVLAEIFIGRFRDGYRQRADPCVDPAAIETIIARHLEQRDRLAAIYGLDEINGGALAVAGMRR